MASPATSADSVLGWAGAPVSMLFVAAAPAAVWGYFDLLLLLLVG